MVIPKKLGSTSFYHMQWPAHHVEAPLDICNHPYTTVETFEGGDGNHTHHRTAGDFDVGALPSVAVRVSVSNKCGRRGEEAA